MPMKNPPHPGLSVRHDCLEPLGLTVTEAARSWVSAESSYQHSSTAIRASLRNGDPAGQGVWRRG